MSASTHELSMFFSTKALLHDVEQLAAPIQEDDLPARAQRADQEIEAMDRADEAIKYLTAMVDTHAGTHRYAQAVDIAFAPMDPANEGGLKRVAEYYRRAELIERL
jgi:predicted HD phosphohydrolase